MESHRQVHHCRVMWSGEVVIDDGWQFSLYDPFWRFYRNRDAGAVITWDGGSMALEAEACVLVPAWGRLRSTCSGRVRHTFVYFEPVGLSGAWSRQRLPHPVVVSRRAEWDPVLAAIPLHQDSPYALHLECQAMLCRAMAEALAAANSASERPDDESQAMRLVEPALRHLESHLHDPLTVADLAALCDVGRDYFTRVFARAMGTTPARYLAERRIAAASQDLRHGDLPIETIAERHGFANRYHFTRVFRRILATSPGRYRRQNLR